MRLIKLKSMNASSSDCSPDVCFQMALESLGWPETDAHFPLEGRILFTQPSEGNSISNWHKKAWTVKLTPVQAILAVQSTEELPEITVRKELIFPSDIAPIKDASLVVIKKEKGAKFTLVRVSAILLDSWIWAFSCPQNSPFYDECKNSASKGFNPAKKAGPSTRFNKHP